MKKLVIFITCITLTFFLLNNCSDSSNPINSQQDQLSDLSKGKPPNKGKPPKDKLSIESFQIIVNGTQTYNIGSGDKPIIDFKSSNTYELKYKVSHPDGYSKVQVYLYYDFDSDEMENYSALQFASLIIDDTEVMSNEEYSRPLTDKVLGPDFNENRFTSNWELMDQKATYYADPNISCPDPLADQYLIQIMVWYGEEVAHNESYVWLIADEGSGELYVSSINIIPTSIKKNRNKPKATVIFLNTNNEYKNARIYYNWGGNIIGNNYTGTKVDYDNDGIITVDGPDYSTRSSGEIIFTVKAIVMTDNVYNPYLHWYLLNKWEWPVVEPFGTLSVP